MESKTAVVFNIQRYCINDGPGIRTTVFFKGCPLRCLWCHNPESNLARPQLMFHSPVCVGCGICIPTCPQNAISIDLRRGKAVTDRTRCTECGTCTAPEICEHGAREQAGTEMTADAIVKEIGRDRIFYKSSGGGATFSGGEPLMRAEFVAEVMAKCREKGISTAVETSGFAPWEQARLVFEQADLILYDVKHMDPEQHKRLTGVSNERIQDNLRRAVKELGKKVWLRLPLIADVNDSEWEVRAVRDLALELREGVEEIWMLPFHTLGIPKLESLDLPADDMDSFQPPSPQWQEEIKALLGQTGIPIKVG